MAAPAEASSDEIDEKRLEQMLALVGPASETRLLRSLIGDLRAALVALTVATDRHDVQSLCNQTHVLASLAGTFGARSLNAAARDLEIRSRSGTALPDCSGVILRAERLISHLTVRLRRKPQ